MDAKKFMNYSIKPNYHNTNIMTQKKINNENKYSAKNKKALSTIYKK